MNNLVFYFHDYLQFAWCERMITRFLHTNFISVINHTVFEITLSYLHIREYTQTMVMY